MRVIGYKPETLCFRCNLQVEYCGRPGGVEVDTVEDRRGGGYCGRTGGGSGYCGSPGGGRNTVGNQRRGVGVGNRKTRWRPCSFEKMAARLLFLSITRKFR